MPTPLTVRFAEWGARLEVSGVPPRVRDQARRAILDTVGVMACGAAHPSAALVRAAVGAPGRCTAVGARPSDARAAALVNGAAAHAWDFDDTSYTGIFHASAIVLPAVLAAAEESGAGDDDLFAAFIVGSEVAYTLAEMVTDRHFFRGWWSTTTLSLVGATAGAARACRLDARRTAHAIGIAAAAAGIGRVLLGTDAKPYLAGETARRAVDFARAGAAGMTGPLGAFEHACGFFALLNGGQARLEAARTLGRRWRLVDPGLLVKLSPVCSGAHAVIEATSRLVRQGGVSASGIARIRCRIPHLVKASLVFDRPRTPQEAQFSLPYAVACAVLHGRVRLEDLSPAEVASAAKRSIMAKVEYAEASEMSTEAMRRRHPEGAEVALTLASGATLKAFCGEPYGMPGNPLSLPHLREKFEACAAFAGVPPRTVAGARLLLEKRPRESVPLLAIIRSVLRAADGRLPGRVRRPSSKRRVRPLDRR